MQDTIRAIPGLVERDDQGQKKLPRCTVKSGYVVGGQVVMREAVIQALVAMWLRQGNHATRNEFLEHVEDEFGSELARDLRKILLVREMRV
jgi:hypothetical protein